MKIFNNPFYNKLVSLLWATWFGHAVLRVLHFSRLDAFGNPIVEKVEWYIFHAFCIDLIWIAISFSPILLYGLFSKPSEKVQKVLLMVYGGLHLILLNITVIDHEFYRFMGGHFSPNMAQTYTNTSSIRELFSMLNGDKSIPYFSFAVFLIGSIAFLYANYWINSRRSESTKKRTLILAIWVLVAYLYTGVFWKGGHRENRLAPIYKIALKAYLESTIEVEPKDIAIWTKEYQSRWNSHYKSQPDYKFNNEEYPFYKIPVEKKCDSLNCVEEVEKPMNVVLIFLESHRGLHQGYLKKYGAESDGTPYLNELAKSSLVFSDAHASGLPTIGAFMATQLSLIDHPLAFLATGFTSTNFISLPDILKAKGYNTSFYTSPDPSWDGQTFWLSKWYDEYHYSRETENDSAFFEYVAKDVITKQSVDKPFMLGMITKTNHYPFNKAPTMPDHKEGDDFAEKMTSNMKYTERHLEKMMKAFQKESWYDNTLFVIMGDHGFPLGEHGSYRIGHGLFKPSTWVGMMIHSPKNVEARVIEFPVSQLDVAPTLLGLMNMKAPNSFMGHDILDSNFISEGKEIRLYKKQDVVVADSEGRNHFELDKIDKAIQHYTIDDVNEQKAIERLDNEMVKKYSAEYKLLRYSVEQNKIGPQ